MGRAIEFDYDRAIDRATRLFRKTGYSQTSLRDLLKAMKIGEGSFYNTLKSKKNLYLECLKHYGETVVRRREDALVSAGSARLGVRALFRSFLDDMDDPKTPRLCLMAGSVSCDVLEDRELREYLIGQGASLGRRLVEALRSGKAAGEFPAGFEPEVVAEVIGTYYQGLRRVVLLGYERGRLEREIEVLLVGLGI